MTTDFTFHVIHEVNNRFSNGFKESELLLQNSGLFTPTPTESAYSGHCLTTTGITWLPTQLSASWTNITWTQLHCNHFPSGIHCPQLVLRHFTLVENSETIFLSLTFFFTAPLQKWQGVEFSSSESPEQKQTLESLRILKNTQTRTGLIIREQYVNLQRKHWNGYN